MSTTIGLPPELPTPVPSGGKPPYDDDDAYTREGRWVCRACSNRKCVLDVYSPTHARPLRYPRCPFGFTRDRWEQVGLLR